MAPTEQRQINKGRAVGKLAMVSAMFEGFGSLYSSYGIREIPGVSRAKKKARKAQRHARRRNHR